LSQYFLFLREKFRVLFLKILILSGKNTKPFLAPSFVLLVFAVLP